MKVDFHTHLDHYAHPATTLQLIETRGILTVAASMDCASYQKTCALFGDSSWVIPTFGIHPACSGADIDWAVVDTLLEASPLIGEIGLDDLWVTDVPLKQQLVVFEYILDHCDRYKKYCVIHTKAAESLVFDVLAGFPQARPVIHWYSGPEDLFRRYLDRGYYCTFGCELAYSAHIRSLAAMTPAQLVLAETDNPGAEPWLGGTDDRPDLIDRVIADIALARSVSVTEAAALVSTNSLRIFQESGIPVPAGF